jgi:hypothetical protein
VNAGVQHDYGNDIALCFVSAVLCSYILHLLIHLQGMVRLLAAMLQHIQGVIASTSVGTRTRAARDVLVCGRWDHSGRDDHGVAVFLVPVLLCECALVSGALYTGGLNHNVGDEDLPSSLPIASPDSGVIHYALHRVSLISASRARHGCTNSLSSPISRRTRSTSTKPSPTCSRRRSHSCRTVSRPSGTWP